MPKATKIFLCAHDCVLHLGPNFGKTNLAYIFGTMLVSVTPSVLVNNFSFADLTLPTIYGLTT